MKKIAEDTPDIHFVGAVFRGIFSHESTEQIPPLCIYAR